MSTIFGRTCWLVLSRLGGHRLPIAEAPRFHEPAYLAQFFDTIEINMSLYQPIRTGLATRWIERVSSNPRFQFTAKVWRKLSHGAGASEEDIQAVRAGFDVLATPASEPFFCNFPFHHAQS